MNTPRKAMLTIVPENATHIAFVNGKTYSREQVNLHDELMQRLKDAQSWLQIDAPVTIQMQIKETLAQATRPTEVKP